MTLLVVALSAFCLLLFGLIMWLVIARSRLVANWVRAATERDAAIDDAQRTRQQASQAEARIHELNVHIARFDERERSLAKREKELLKRQELISNQIETSFQAMASKALDANNRQFLDLASERFKAEQLRGQQSLRKRETAFEEMVKPIGDTLKRADEQLASMEKERIASFSRMTQQMKDVNRANLKLREETTRLVKALREPHVRGRYGELQLQRVAELAGMTSYCDFDVQDSTRDDDGRVKRPDMVVRLPNEREVVVDAKTNIRAYLDAIEAPSQEKAERYLESFANDVLSQAKSLGSKKYWSAYAGSPEFVVMFVPGDQFLDAALSRRPELLELAAERQVILASPSTLIGLLKAVAVGWREQRIAERAEALMKLGSELHERAGIAFKHAADLGESLKRTVDRYNSFVSSVDTRLTPTLRRFEDGGITSSRKITDLSSISTVPRQIESKPDEDRHQQKMTFEEELETEELEAEETP